VRNCPFLICEILVHLSITVAYFLEHNNHKWLKKDLNSSLEFHTFIAYFLRAYWMWGYSDEQKRHSSCSNNQVNKYHMEGSPPTLEEDLPKETGSARYGGL
jgi:hypothetical protein